MAISTLPFRIGLTSSEIDVRGRPSISSWCSRTIPGTPTKQSERKLKSDRRVPPLWTRTPRNRADKSQPSPMSAASPRTFKSSLWSPCRACAQEIYGQPPAAPIIIPLLRGAREALISFENQERDQYEQPVYEGGENFQPLIAERLT